MAQPMRRSLTAAVVAILATACSSSPVSPDVARSASWTANPSSPHRPPAVIFVISQGLFFDTCAAPAFLPMHGEFQLLFNGRTELGPGQVGFLNGRWWEDLNGDGNQDAGDHFFFCPLLLPGRVTP